MIFEIIMIVVAVAIIYFIIKEGIRQFRECDVIEPPEHIPDILILRKADHYRRCSQFRDREHNEYGSIRSFDFFIDYDTPDEWLVSGKMQKTDRGWENMEMEYYHQELKNPPEEIEKLAYDFLTEKYKEI